ncbi:hypothetical protein [Peristeroidobacter agariperforans]|uniref:hypothetical protein n=1 Tax=Peristeroidobacter agariperforans TaxID=268404 RepID=UPI00101D165E|nr:hypothetical protein [Peristeroidobacter agariperforans]
MDISALQSRLPAIRKWIDTTVEEYRPTARPLISLGFSRLAHYFDTETLKRASVVEVDAVPKPPLTALGLHQFSEFEQMNGAGVTYGDIYFVERSRARDESLHFHELVHTIQWQLLGTERFILAYALGHLAGGGYENNPLEEVAHTLEGMFAREPRLFRAEPIVSQHLERVVPSLMKAAGL